MYHEQLSQLNGERPWDQLSNLTNTRQRWLSKAAAIEGMLYRGGFVIVPSTEALLRKGEGVKLK
jgi:hypothetical protein